MILKNKEKEEDEENGKDIVSNPTDGFAPVIYIMIYKIPDDLHLKDN